jgi:CPA2 family monovalent cation:H+ antiporter-2
MPETYFLSEAVVIFGTAVLVAWLFRMLRAPAVIGFLITGMVIGPSGWRLIAQNDVSQFSDLGLVLLLFTIGLELSPEPLVRSGARLVAATLVQIIVTAAVTVAFLSLASSLPWLSKAILGVAVALSSTAIVLKQMSDRGEINSTTGGITTGILLLQDVTVIAFMLLISLAGAETGAGGWTGVARTAAGLAGLGAVTVAARRLLPPILDQVVRHGGRELMTLFAVLMACGGAWLAAVVGWSPALGACIAGLLLAEVDQRHQLVAEITPFRDVFNALFFVSLGMSVNLEVVAGNMPLLIGMILATLLLKPFITAGGVLVAGWPLRVGLQVGVGLCTVSEFSYVLARQAHAIRVLPSTALDMLIAYTAGTMMVGALLYPLAGSIGAGVARLIRPDAAPPDAERQGPQRFENHVILVGYGFTGSNLARMLKATRVPHCVIEMNQGFVKEARQAGTPVIIGDATRMAILDLAGINAARALVTAVNDAQATQRIVAQAAARRPDLYILARTAFVRDIDVLYHLGAKLVVPQDFETSVEIAAHVLKQFGIPDNIVEAQIASVRAGGYGMLRGKATDRAAHAELIKILERTATQTFYLAENTFPCGRTIAEVNLRAVTGCTIIAVVRSGKPAANPPPDFQFQANDVLVLVGAHAQIEAAKAVLQRPAASLTQE